MARNFKSGPCLLSISDAHQTIPGILQEYKNKIIDREDLLPKNIFSGPKNDLFCSVSSFEWLCSHDVTLTSSKRRRNLSFYRIHHLRKSKRTDENLTSLENLGNAALWSHPTLGSSLEKTKKKEKIWQNTRKSDQHDPVIRPTTAKNLLLWTIWTCKVKKKLKWKV